VKKEEDIDGFACQVSYVLKTYIAFYVTLSLDIFVLVSELGLYFLLTRTLKTQLNYYYHKVKYDLLVLTIISIVFFTTQLILKIPSKYFNTEPSIIIYIGDFSDVRFTTLQFVFVMLIDLFSYAPLYLHIYFNIKNINFKTYLLEIMKGWNIDHYYQNASIFIWIRENRCPALETTTDSMACQPELITSGLLNSFNSDSSKNSDYKKEYLKLKSEERQLGQQDQQDI